MGNVKVKYITGKCSNCGANRFIFDEVEQTFVCEYCKTEVYAVVPEDTKVSETPKIEEEKWDEDKWFKKDETKEEPKQEPEPVHHNRYVSVPIKYESPPPLNEMPSFLHVLCVIGAITGFLICTAAFILLMVFTNDDLTRLIPYGTFFGGLILCGFCASRLGIG